MAAPLPLTPEELITASQWGAEPFSRFVVLELPKQRAVLLLPPELLAVRRQVAPRLEAGAGQAGGPGAVWGMPPGMVPGALARLRLFE